MDRAVPPTPTPSLAELMSVLGAEVGAPLSLALERLQAALASRDPSEGMLISVREPLRRARDATLIASQIGRLASGRVQPDSEPCALHRLLLQVIELRRREAQARGLHLRLDADEAEVRSDPALLPRLIHALLDWALAHTHSSLELALKVSSWPPQARLTLRFATRDLDQSVRRHPDDLDGLRWQLVLHMAATLGLTVRRDDEAGVSVTQLDMPLLQAEELPKFKLDLRNEAPARNSQPFAGWSALLVGNDPQLHTTLQHIMEPLGWTVDRAVSVDDAFQQSLRALPQAVVVDGALAGSDLDQWRAHVLGEAPGLCFIEVHAAAPSRAQSGAQLCLRHELGARLPALLRRALAPRTEELTFRL